MQDKKFLEVIEATPLVSIDLIVEDSSGRILLGKRNNRPAQGFWFVPGGRIRKNETLGQAFTRIANCELGTDLAIKDATPLGAFDHIYPDNFANAAGINTHYVALGFRVKLNELCEIQIDEQHSEVNWWPLDELLSSEAVHPNTKLYFN